MHVLTCTKNNVSQKESIFPQNAKCRTNVVEAMSLLRENARVNTHVAHSDVIPAKSISLVAICVTPSVKLVFYDFETDFTSGEHIVNFDVLQYTSEEERVFKGYNALNDFCEFFSRKHI